MTFRKGNNTHSGKDSLSISAECTLKLVKDAIVLVQVAQLAPKMVVHIDRLDRFVLHIDVPNSQCQVVPRQDVSTVLGEFDIGDGRDDLGEERLV